MLPPPPPPELPEILLPEFPPRSGDAASTIRHFLLNREGVVGAWLSPNALDGHFDQGLMLVLVEDSPQGSEALNFTRATLPVVLLDRAAIEDLIEEDEELVAAIHQGYRVCGVDEACRDLEALALQIVRGS